jgi:hypothetical protein
MFNSDLTANRPAAGIVGRIFIAIDSPYGIFRDTGTAWDQISSAGGATTIYTGDGTLTGNRTISSGGFQLVINPQTTFFSSLTASTSASSFSVLGSNALSFASGFSSSNIGNVYGANGAINSQNFLGNATFAQANLASAMVNVNKIDFGSGGHTITMTQSTAPGIRAMTGVQNQIQFTGSHNGTISHAAISQNLGFFRESGSTRTLTITNAYSLLLNPLDDYGAGFTFTNRWGIYQAGASDPNFFAGLSTFANSLSITKNQNAATSLEITNTTTGSAALAQITFTTNLGTSASMGKVSTSYPTYKILSGGGFNFFNTLGGDYAFLNDFGTGGFKWAGGASLTAQMTLTSTGNLLVGSTTDTGEKVQITGTTRINGVFNTTSGNLITGGGASQLVWNNAAGALVGTNNYIGTNAILAYNISNGAVGSVSVGANFNAVASAIVEIRSTTKGFLPSRMLNSERTAIASPAVGLIVYCTDAVEGLYIYKSTGWTLVI